jgi:hypothetical protein
MTRKQQYIGLLTEMKYRLEKVLSLWDHGVKIFSYDIGFRFCQELVSQYLKISSKRQKIAEFLMNILSLPITFKNPTLVKNNN